MSLLDKINQTAKILKDHKIDNPRYEAELIYSHVLSVSRQMLLFSEFELTRNQIKEIESIVKKRITGLPIQYLIGEVEFFDLKISVAKEVFIPRPETELMTEYAIREIKHLQLKKPLVLDVCTGSGCIALAIAKYVKDVFVVGTDISEIAIKYASKNAQRNEIDNVCFIRCDTLRALKVEMFDMIISNPPYIKTEDIPRLQIEVRNEPIIALDGGEDGLDFYRWIIKNISHSIKDGAIIMFELGFNQSDEVSKMLSSNHFTNIKVIKDYAGIDRIAMAQRQEA